MKFRHSKTGQGCIPHAGGFFYGLVGLPIPISSRQDVATGYIDDVGTYPRLRRRVGGYVYVPECCRSRHADRPVGHSKVTSTAGEDEMPIPLVVWGVAVGA